MEHQQRAVQAVLHYPRLDTVIVVEETIKKRKRIQQKRSCSEACPKK
jgi:hypothetical protein